MGKSETASKKPKKVLFGPIRIPEEHNDLLLSLIKPHVTKSDLIREAVYLLLINKGLVIATQPTRAALIMEALYSFLEKGGFIKDEIIT